MSYRDKIKQDLINANIKVTDARYLILELMHKKKEGHFSAEEIHGLLSEHNIGLATVYRTLVQLEAVGLILRHSFLDGVAVYELNDGDHGHTVCLQCGAISEFNDDLINTQQRAIAEAMQMTTVRFSHTIYGICQKCSSK